MKDRRGNWLNGDKEIVDFIRRGFSELFTSSHNSSSLTNWDPSFWNYCLKEEDSTNLAILISANLVNLLKPLVLVVSTQVSSNASIVSGWLCKELKTIFNSRVVLDYLNQTLITLITKCKSPKLLTKYCLLSLCNIYYKVETKVIIGQIRPFLSDLVSPLQAAFVPKRKGMDNAIIVQELIHTMSKRKAYEG